MTSDDAPRGLSLKRLMPRLVTAGLAAGNHEQQAVEDEEERRDAEQHQRARLQKDLVDGRRRGDRRHGVLDAVEDLRKRIVPGVPPYLQRADEKAVVFDELVDDVVTQHVERRKKRDDRDLLENLHLVSAFLAEDVDRADDF